MDEPRDVAPSGDRPGHETRLVRRPRVEFVGRSAGDQFVVVATHADFDGAQSLSKRVRAAVTLDPVQVDGNTIPVELRIGGATRRSEGVEILEDLFHVAEEALQDASAEDAPFKVISEVL